jgi:RNA polymerase sigma-70 factor (ECF subfamily)
MDHLSDEDLIQQSKGGDALAFKELVIRHEGKVAGVVHSMLGKTDEAQDVGQEVFVRFYQSLDKFKGESAVSTYLIRIAINLSLNELKRRKRKQSMFTDIELGYGKEMHDEKKDVAEMVHYELKQLDADFRTVVTLRLIEGYSTEETASILNIPLGTVLSRLARAQKKLKMQLTKYREL